jgi:hypothetical protein
MAFACKICIAERGLKGSEIASLPQTEEELFDHIERHHHMPIQRSGETLTEAANRFYAKYPEALDPATCRCPECAAKRKAAGNWMGIRRVVICRRASDGIPKGSKAGYSCVVCGLALVATPSGQTWLNNGGEAFCNDCGFALAETSDFVRSATPKAGDLAMCVKCGHVAIFAEGLTLREPTAEEADEIRRDPLIQQHQQAVWKMHELGFWEAKGKPRA